MPLSKHNQLSLAYLLLTMPTIGSDLCRVESLLSEAYPLMKPIMWMYRLFFSSLVLLPITLVKQHYIQLYAFLIHSYPSLGLVVLVLLSKYEDSFAS